MWVIFNQKSGSNFNQNFQKQLEDFGVLKTPTAKKLINQGKIEAIKIGAKLHITKAEVIRYLTDRTIKKVA